MQPDDDRPVLVHPSAGAGLTPPHVLPAPRFDHLVRLTHPMGVWEHAELTSPRTAHGFCTDDNARALIVVCRQSDAATGELADLAAIYLRFVLDARTTDGGFHNRRGQDGIWLDDIGSDDSQGRAWWALGVVSRHGAQPWMRRAGMEAFDSCSGFSSEHLRANAFAVLGAVELLAVAPDHADARTLLRRGVEVITEAAHSRISWPEARLTYDNARLPEALLAAGATLGDRRLTRMGLRLLTWLVQVEGGGRHFSFTPAGGYVPGEPRRRFDQQPIEAVAMAEACHRAWTATRDPAWRTFALRAAGWFVGLNDTGAILYDAESGGTCDGLMRHGVNENQGAESTLAGLAALRVAADCASGDTAVTIT